MKSISSGMKSIIIGTAGHIDHGKTALVRALTGIDADRLPEEKRRGITIDIGFADLDLGEVCIGFVDVPGHERFVKNMLAGAHGIDAVALVIAADESVMPQTREHFDICRLLDVQKGIVVITKSDLVDEDLLQLVRAEAQELVAGSFLEGAPVVAVSSRTGEGTEELKEALREVGSRVSERSSDYVARLPIDRAFTMRGFGAVVTGTLIAGEISEGDELELLPGERRTSSLATAPPARPVRVRGVQVHGSAVTRAVAGQRTAINLGGVEASAIERGMVLAPIGRLRPTQIVDAKVKLLDDAPRALRSRQRVRVHIGAAEVLARVRVLETSGEIAAGATGFAQLRFESPIVGVPGDRFILRSYSPQRTIGGGTILNAFAAKHRARELAYVRERLTALQKSDRAQQVAEFAAIAEPHGLRRADLAAHTGWRDEVIDEAAGRAIASGAIVDAEGLLVSSQGLEAFKRQVLEEIAAHHQREPLSRGLAKETLRERRFATAPPEIFRAVLNQLESAGHLVAAKDVVRAREHTRELSDSDARLRDQLEEIYREAALAAPTINEAFERARLAASQQQHGRKILQLLIDAGLLVRVSGETFFYRAALDDLIKKLRDYASKQSDRAIDVAKFKDLAGVSRKYAIPLLEYLDRQHVTRREGDRRIVM
jgi:selenocysteine-specific elongation factor